MFHTPLSIREAIFSLLLLLPPPHSELNTALFPKKCQIKQCITVQSSLPLSVRWKATSFLINRHFFILPVSDAPVSRTKLLLTNDFLFFSLSLFSSLSLVPWVNRWRCQLISITASFSCLCHRCKCVKKKNRHKNGWFKFAGETRH